MDALVAHQRIVQWQRARHDERVFVTAVPQPVDDDGHVLQHPARALKLVQRGPVLVQPVKHLRVNRVGVRNALLVARLLRLARKLGRVLSVQLAKSPCRGVHLRWVAHGVKQPPAHNLEGLFRRHRLPDRFDAAKVFFQHIQRALPLRACRLGF